MAEAVGDNKTFLIVSGVLISAVILDMLLKKTTHHVRETYNMQAEPQYGLPIQWVDQIHASFKNLMDAYRGSTKELLSASAVNALTKEEKQSAIKAGERVINQAKVDCRRMADKNKLINIYQQAISAFLEQLNEVCLRNHNFSLQRQNILGITRGVEHPIPLLGLEITNYIRTLQPATD